jgi:cyclic pyranopterin phosphate synthase
MRDSFNREINYLRVSITDRCNLRCVYCMPKEGLSLLGHEDILRYEEILRIIRVAVKLGITKVRITGGEPLVRRGAVDFIASLMSLDGLADVSLTTNGILLETFAEDLAHAGVKRINISLDSLDPVKYGEITRGGNLQSVLKGIDAVQLLGFSPIKINIVAVRGCNDDEILDFARLAHSRPFQVRFIELMPFGGSGLSEGQFIPNIEILDRIRTVYRLSRVNGGEGNGGPARMYHVEGGQGEIGFISPLTHHFCHACNRLRLTADGRLRACLLRERQADLRTPLRNGCDDRALEELVRKTIEQKPRGHEVILGDASRRACATNMSKIGG